MTSEHRVPGHDHEESRPDEIDELLADYIDRLNAGERIFADEVLFDHPESGGEIIARLESFLEALDSPLELGMSPRRTDDARPLGTLGDYTLKRQIGRGGMGVVYEAWQGSMDRVVALKVLPPAIAADDRAYGRFMQEARAAGKLGHPNVVAVHASGQDAQTPYYAMEYVEGETLAEILARIRDAEPETETPFGPKSRQDFFIRLGAAFAEVADGLQHAHAKGVTHRDIKPSNLILDREGRLRILDFGLARLEGQESLTLTGDVVGTPLYMSPEQARRRRVPVDHRTDIYSLGATIYEAICGRPPFRGKDHADTLTQIVERDPPEPRKLNSRVPRDLETIVLKCLRKEAGDRYGTAEALAQDLGRFVRGDAVEARPESRLQRVLRFADRQRQPILITMALVVLVAVCGVLFVDAYRSRHERRLSEYGALIEDGFASFLLASLPRVDAEALERGPGLLGELVDVDVRLLLSPELPDPLDRAIDLWRRAVDLLPSRPEARAYLARADMLARRNERAREPRARESSGEEKPRKHSFGRGAAVLDGEANGIRRSNAWARAKQAMHAGSWIDAVDAYSVLIARRGDEQFDRDRFLGSEVEVYLGRGVAYLETEIPDALRRAEWDFLTVKRSRPELLAPRILLGKALHLQGKARLAEEEFLRLREITRHTDLASYWIALTYWSLHEFERALQWARELPTHIGRRLEAACLYHLYRFGEAEESARALVDESPTDLGGLLVLGLVLDQQLWEDARTTRASDKRAELLEIARRAIAIEPENASTQLLLAIAHFRQRAFPRAVELCRTLMARHPESPPAYFYLALILRNHGKRAEAIKQLELAIKKFPGVAQGNFLLGAELVRQGEHARAREELEKAREKGLSTSRVLANLGWALAGLGLQEESITLLRTALEKPPRSSLAYHVLAGVERRRGDRAAALTTLDEGLDSLPGSARLHCLKGEILQEDARPREALIAYLESLSLWPSRSNPGHAGVARCLDVPPEPFPREAAARALEAIERLIHEQEGSRVVLESFGRLAIPVGGEFLERASRYLVAAVAGAHDGDPALASVSRQVEEALKARSPPPARAPRAEQ